MTSTAGHREHRPPRQQPGVPAAERR